MKQGTGVTTISGRKVEPTAHAVSVDKVAGIGVQQIRYKSVELYKGKGFEAPKAGSEIHHCGSQGRH